MWAGLYLCATSWLGKRHTAGFVAAGGCHVGFVGGMDDSARRVWLGALAAFIALDDRLASVGPGLVGLGSGTPKRR